MFALDMIALALLAQTATAAPAFLDALRAQVGDGLGLVVASIVAAALGLVATVVAWAKARLDASRRKAEAEALRAEAEASKAAADAEAAKALAAQAEADRSRRLTATVIRGVEAATKARCDACFDAPAPCADCAARARITKDAISAEAKAGGFFGALKATVKAVTEPERRAAGSDVPDST